MTIVKMYGAGLLSRGEEERYKLYRFIEQKIKVYCSLGNDFDMVDLRNG